MNLYFISGLGADERVFKNLTLPETFNIHHIKWPALSPKESLASYVLKVADLIDNSTEFAIIGLSFGGIVATELTKVLQPRHTIIVSSISSRKELPKRYKTCARLGLNKLIPAWAMNKVYPFTYWSFGISKQQDKQLLKQVIHDTSPQFLKWAINEILNWQNRIRPENITHIHGTADKLFPFKLTHADVAIKDGGHLMVYVNADIISDMIVEQLSVREYASN